MTKISVYEYNTKNFKKGGGLAKRAYPEFSVTTGDTEASDPTNYDQVAEGIKKAVKGIHSVVTPYVFTHIIVHSNAEREDGGKKTYFVFEEVITSGHRFMTSPTKLLEALKTN